LGVILFFTSPISGHAVAISAKQNDVKPILKKAIIENSEIKND
jgi:multisubunit Na+/H+ antiporter MnhG subunit